MFLLAKEREAKKRTVLKASEKLDIVHKVLVEFKMVKDVAKEYRVTISTVNMLVSKSRKKPKLISELFDKRILKEQKQKVVEDVVQGLVESQAFIDSCKMVRDKV